MYRPVMARRWLLRLEVERKGGGTGGKGVGVRVGVRRPRARGREVDWGGSGMIQEIMVGVAVGVD